MFKVTTVSILVLLLASGAWAQIGHTQGFNIGGANYTGLLGGGLVQSGNYGTIGQVQKTTNASGSLFVKQTQGGNLIQEGTIEGDSGCRCHGGGTDSQIWQDAKTGGFQGQLAKTGWHGTTGTATQGLGAGLGTDVIAKNGGTTTGYQNFVGGQSQLTVTPAGVGLQWQNTEATQYVNIQGAPYSRADVSSTLNVGGTQTQTITGH